MAAAGMRLPTAEQQIEQSGADSARKSYLRYVAGLSGVGGGGIVATPGATTPTTSTAAAKPQIVQKAPTKVGTPTFAPPAPSGPDPRIAALVSELSQQPQSTSNPRIDSVLSQIEAANRKQDSQRSRLEELSAPINIARPDLSATTAQSAELRALLSQLLRGEGIDIGNVNTDPEARAYQVAKRRAAQRLRESEAARLGATGLSGSGDFDARVAQIEEATGEDIAGFEAGLAGRRRGEAQQGAIQGATLSLSDLDRQSREAEGRYDRDVNLEQARRAGLVTQTQLESDSTRDELGLLNALMAQDSSERASGAQRTSQQQALLNTLMDEQARVDNSAQSRASQDTEMALRLAEEARTAKLFKERRLPTNTRSGGVVRR